MTNRANKTVGATGTVTLAAVLAIGSLSFADSVSAQTIGPRVKVAPNLYQIGLDPATDRLFVASAGTGEETPARVVILDGDSLEQIGAIEVADTPVYGLHVNSASRKLYGTDTRGGVLVVADIDSGERITSIGNGDRAHLREVRIDEAANRVYVTEVGRRGGTSALWVIDGETDELLKRVEIDTQALTGIALDPANGRIFGTGMEANEVVAIDIESGETLEHWPAGGERPTNITLDSAGGRLFVANQGGTVTVLDSRDGSLIESIDTGEGTLEVWFDAQANRVYATNFRGSSMSIIDADSYEVLANLETGSRPHSVAIDHDDNRLFVSSKSQSGGRRGAPPPGADAPEPVEDPLGDTVTIVNF